MKAIIEFTLPDEQSEYKMHTQAGAMAAAIYEFTNELRAKAKYAEKGPESWEKVKADWWSILAEYKIDPYES